MAADNRKLKSIDNGDVPKKKRISTLGQRHGIGFEVIQVKSSTELLAQYKIKRETFQQEHKDIFRAQGVNNQGRKQPVIVEEDACEDETPKLKKKRKIQPMSLFQESEHNNGNPLKNTKTGLHSKDVTDQNSEAGNLTKVAAENNMKTSEKNSTFANQTTAETESNSNPKSNTAELSANSTKSGMTLDMYFKRAWDRSS
ncbi:hypothetical protein PIB30_040940 [Stylosanthes scabra]|uniref:Uncharacterized protein n=1 Tax=Stylosanthes scabra TaxID=79078 RepID=A0ABU6ZDH8_9FABA|nr:hypothetical protein [Stylosanthes scabra]